MKFLFKNNNYMLLISGTTISSLGSFSFNYGLMAYLYYISDMDKRVLALSQLFFVVGILLGNLSGGVFGEKRDRKKLILLSETIRIPIMALMFLAYDQIGMLLVLHGLKSYFAGISGPIKRALILDIVPKRDVSSANTLFTTLYAVVQIIGPLVGTTAYAIFKELNYLIAFNILGFVIAATTYFFMKGKSPEGTRQKVNMIKDIKTAVDFIKSRLDLRALFARHIIVGAVSGFLIPLLLPFTVEFLNKTEKEYGIMMALFGIGGVFGGLLNRRVTSFIALGPLLVVSGIVEPILMIIWALNSNYLFSLVVIFCWGALFFIRTPGQFNYIGNHVDPKYISRTHSFLDFTFTLTNVSAILLISLIGKKIGAQTILITVGVAYLLSALIILPLKSTKTLYQN